MTVSPTATNAVAAKPELMGATHRDLRRLGLGREEDRELHLGLGGGADMGDARQQAAGDLDLWGGFARARQGGQVKKKRKLLLTSRLYRVVLRYAPLVFVARCGCGLPGMVQGRRRTLERTSMADMAEGGLGLGSGRRRRADRSPRCAP